MKRIQPLASLLLFAVLPASAAWTVTRTGAPTMSGTYQFEDWY